jgi:hypothetical protein
VKEGKYQEAVVQFRNGIEIAHPVHCGTLSTRAHQQAYGELLTTVGLDSGNADGQLKLATLLFSARKYNDAQAASEESLPSGPHNSRARTVLGEKHGALEAWPSAIRESQPAIALDPTQVENSSELAQSYPYVVHNITGLKCSTF